MPGRSTEVTADCFGRQVLQWFFEEDQADTSYFTLGSILHDTIQLAIETNIDLPLALEHAHKVVALALDDIGTSGNIKMEASQRGFDSMHEDAERMISNWFAKVPPDAEKRHPIYNDYEWPPRVEVPFAKQVPGALKYGVWGVVDAVFLPKAEVPTLIVDWKSSTQRQKSDFQLNFYRFGLELPDALAAYHNLDRVRDAAIIQMAEPYPGHKDIIRGARLLELRKEAVVLGEMPLFTPDWYCNYCPVQHLCPVDGDPRKRDENLANLKFLLPLAEPMVDIPVVVL